MSQTILLVFNRASGTGQNDDTASRLGEELSAGRDWQVETSVVDDHGAARAACASFARSARVPATIIVAGGGGTLRAALEGVCDASGDRVPLGGKLRLAALRLGSGNVVARNLGAPADPMAAIRGIAENLEAGRIACCSTMRVHVGNAGGRTEVRHVLALGGLGQFGRVPGDLARSHAHFPAARQLLTRVIPIEKLTNAEYALDTAARLALCAAAPSRCEEVEVSYRRGAGSPAGVADVQTRRLRLLAGFILNFRIEGLPVEPGVRWDEPAIAVHLVPLGNRFTLVARAVAGQLLRGSVVYRIEPGDSLEIALADRDTAPFFLDEDPEMVHGALTIEPGGMIPFVPGPDYRTQSALPASW